MKKVLLITGGNRGLGKAIIDLALRDNQVLIVSLSRSLNEDHMQISEDKIVFIRTDLSKPFSSTGIVNINRYIYPDTVLYFFNNASVILPINEIGQITDLEIKRSIMVNVEFPTRCINYLKKEFSNSRLKFINITSGAGKNPIANWSLYGASKAYINMFFKVLEAENKDSEYVEVFNIDPGTMDTGMQTDIRGNTFPEQRYFQSLKECNKLIKPEDAARMIFNEICF